MSRLTRLMGLLLIAALLLPFFAAAEDPQWDFPLAADLVADREGLLKLSNRKKPLEAGFVPYPLVKLKLRAVGSGHELRQDAAEALTRFFAAAEEAGYKLYLKSAYRSYQTQNSMYHNRLERYARDDGVVAYPGSSDHQTGLGVDILNYEWTKKEGMTPAFGDTAEARWMEEHCAAFGFILRYMPEKQDITGIIYEPWHFRYVGEPVARYIMQERLSLEEFDEALDQAVLRFEQAGGNFHAYVMKLKALPPPVKLDETDEAGDSEFSLFYPTKP